VEAVVKNYINTFSPDFLFIRGGTNHAHNIPNFGNMYLIEAPFLIFGFVWLIRNSGQVGSKTILYWLLLSPIAASITKDAPHSARTESMLPALQITTSLGLFYIFSIIKHKKNIVLYICIISLGYLLNFFQYIDRYYIHFPALEHLYWGGKYKIFSEYLASHDTEEKKIIITNPEESPYIFLLFYLHYDPFKYQENAVRYPTTTDGFLHIQSFGQFEFRSIDWGKDLFVPNQILVADPETIPHHVRDSPNSTLLQSSDSIPVLSITQT
jgi:hypothetical protein